MKAKWIKVAYVLFVVLIPIPLNLLAQHFRYLESRTFNSWFRTAQYALMFFCYLFLGAYIGIFKNLKAIHTQGKWRVQWPEFALGVVLCIIGFLMKLVWARGLYATIRFIYDNDMLIKIFTFNDGLYTWVLMAGFFMVNSFEKVPSKEKAREETTRAGNETDPSKPE